MSSPYLLAALLIFFRLSPLFLVAPIIGFARVPVLFRLILTVSFSLILAGTLSAYPAADNSMQLITQLISEALIGISLAFSIHAAIAGLTYAGQLIDMQIGFAAAAIFDPTTNQNTSPTGEVFTIAALAVFVIFAFDHKLLQAMSLLLEALPPGSAFQFSESWVGILGRHLVIGFLLASPVIISLWLTDVFIAYLSRSLPQTPMYFVALPIKVMIGIISLAWLISEALEPMLRLYHASLLSWDKMFIVK